MALQHDVRGARSGVPEVHAAVLGARQDPVAVGGEGDGEDEVLDYFSHVSVPFLER